MSRWILLLCLGIFISFSSSGLRENSFKNETEGDVDYFDDGGDDIADEVSVLSDNSPVTEIDNWSSRRAGTEKRGKQQILKIIRRDMREMKNFLPTLANNITWMELDVKDMNRNFFSVMGDIRVIKSETLMIKTLSHVIWQNITDARKDHKRLYQKVKMILKNVTYVVDDAQKRADDLSSFGITLNTMNSQFGDLKSVMYTGTGKINEEIKLLGNVVIQMGVDIYEMRKNISRLFPRKDKQILDKLTEITTTISSNSQLTDGMFERIGPVVKEVVNAVRQIRDIWKTTQNFTQRIDLMDEAMLAIIHNVTVVHHTVVAIDDKLTKIGSNLMEIFNYVTNLGYILQKFGFDFGDLSHRIKSVNEGVNRLDTHFENVQNDIKNDLFEMKTQLRDMKVPLISADCARPALENSSTATYPSQLPSHYPPGNGQMMPGYPPSMPTNGQPISGYPPSMPTNGQPIPGYPSSMPTNGQPIPGYPSSMPTNGQPIPDYPPENGHSRPGDHSTTPPWTTEYPPMHYPSTTVFVPYPVYPTTDNPYPYPATTVFPPTMYYPLPTSVPPVFNEPTPTPSDDKINKPSTGTQFPRGPDGPGLPIGCSDKFTEICACSCPCDCTCPTTKTDLLPKRSTNYMRFLQHRQPQCQCICSCPCAKADPSILAPTASSLPPVTGRPADKPYDALCNSQLLEDLIREVHGLHERINEIGKNNTIEFKNTRDVIVEEVEKQFDEFGREMSLIIDGTFNIATDAYNFTFVLHDMKNELIQGFNHVAWIITTVSAEILDAIWHVVYRGRDQNRHGLHFGNQYDRPHAPSHQMPYPQTSLHPWRPRPGRPHIGPKYSSQHKLQDSNLENLENLSSESLTLMDTDNDTSALKTNTEINQESVLARRMLPNNVPENTTKKSSGKKKKKRKTMKKKKKRNNKKEDCVTTEKQSEVRAQSFRLNVPKNIGYPEESMDYEDYDDLGREGDGYDVRMMPDELMDELGTEVAIPEDHLGVIEAPIDPIAFHNLLQKHINKQWMKAVRPGTGYRAKGKRYNRGRQRGRNRSRYNVVRRPLFPAMTGFPFIPPPMGLVPTIPPLTLPNALRITPPRIPVIPQMPPIPAIPPVPSIRPIPSMPDILASLPDTISKGPYSVSYNDGRGNTWNVNVNRRSHNVATSEFNGDVTKDSDQTDEDQSEKTQEIKEEDQTEEIQEVAEEHQTGDKKIVEEHQNEGQETEEEHHSDEEQEEEEEHENDEDEETDESTES